MYKRVFLQYLNVVYLMIDDVGALVELAFFRFKANPHSYS
jgi:hypothetical protein